MKYSLFLVEDEKCSFKYLGATTLWDKFVKGKYKGSGIEWAKHLKECSCPHNRVFLLHATNDYEIHKRVALECSNKWNVKDNPLFLNTKTELGVPEILDDELHEFRQKIGYRDYDKLVKDQMDPDIKMYTAKEEKIMKGQVIETNLYLLTRPMELTIVQLMISIISVTLYLWIV